MTQATHHEILDIFNLSYSCYSNWKDSQIQFYFEKIKPTKPDTWTPDGFGAMGNVVHNCGELYIRNKNIDLITEFNKSCVDLDVIHKYGFNKKPLSREKYFLFLKRLVKKVDSFKYDKLIAEEQILLNHKDMDNLKLKGFIDVVGHIGNEVDLIDWKTNSTSNYEMHRTQRLFYAYLYFIKYGIIPRKCTWYYLATNEEESDSFTFDDLDKFHRELIAFKNKIVENGYVIGRYEIGNYSSPFNSRKKACQEEEKARFNKNVIRVRIKNNRLIFTSELDKKIVKAMNEKYKFFDENAPHKKTFKNGLWDGWVRIFDYQTNSLPFGFFAEFKRFLKVFNEHFKTEYELSVTDERDQDIMNKTFNTKFKKLEYTPRYYQNDAVEAGIKNEVGILYGGTACVSGDTLIDLPRDRKKYPNGVPIIELIGNLDKYKETKTYNIETHKFELSEIKNVWCSGEDDIFEVEIITGSKIKATLNHRFLVDVGTQDKVIYEYKTLKQIKKEFDDSVTKKETPTIFLVDQNGDSIRISNITHIGEQKVYDMEVGKNHNFVGNNIVVHNCGKTLIAEELIRKLNKRTLFIINNIELVEQTAEAFEDMLGVNIGIMTEGRIDITKQITVATIQTLYRAINWEDSLEQYKEHLLKKSGNKKLSKEQLILYNDKKKKLKRKSHIIQQYLGNVPFVIYDECHLVSDSKMYRFMADNMMNLKYIIGLTGTPFRTDGSTMLMNGMLGHVVWKMESWQLEKEGFTVPTKCFFVNYFDIVNEKQKYHEAYIEKIVECDNRNLLIKMITDYVKEGKKILVTTKIVDHAKIIGELLGTEYIVGETNKKERKRIYSKFKGESEGIMVGSIKIFSAGIDVPDMDGIINCTSHKNGKDSVQLVGRVKRKSKNKNYGFFIDIMDYTKFFNSSAKERIKYLELFQNEVNVVDRIEEINLEGQRS